MKHLPYALKGNWDHVTPSIDITHFSNIKNDGSLKKVTTPAIIGVGHFKLAISYKRNQTLQTKCRNES